MTIAAIIQASKFPGTITNTTVTTGGVAQQLAAANPARGIIRIQNTSDIDLWVRFGAVAAIDAGIKIIAGETYANPTTHCPTGLISIFGITAGKKFSHMIY